MKCTIKKRGLTLLGVILGIGVVGTSAPTAIHYVAQRRAEDRLDTIVRNLAGLDMAANQWSARVDASLAPTRAQLTGEEGNVAYLQWPTGPVTGTYAVGAPNRTIAEHEIPARATFDGGSKGPMNRLEWQRTCGADPAGCGL
ncbi:MAG TPA: hypothetical protein VKT78_00165 [Fimbriimonadaceae bacterium]|nr:hypothetical protein [Fimbriimonadaceae bacterium]